MTRARRKPSLPPLVRYQVDIYLVDLRNDGGAWGTCPGNYFSIKEARQDWQSRDYPWGSMIIIRRLSDGRIVFRNKAAKEAGY